MKTEIITVMVFAVLVAPMLYADRLADIESAMIADRQKEQEVQRQREAEARQAKQESEKMRREIEAAKQRQKVNAEIEAERKRRYPIEQKQRAEYVSVKLGGISFDWKSYVRMQKDLERYVYSIEVTEKKWAELQNFQRDKNWLGMLGAIAECEMKDYPDKRRIDTLINKLRLEKFHIEIKFTHAIRVYVREPPFDARDFYEQLYHRGDCLFSFNIDSTKKGPAIMIYALVESHKGSVHEIDYAFGSKKNKIQSDSTLGRISQQERETALERANDEYQRQLTEWMETTPVRIGSDKPIPGREKPMASVAVRSYETGNNSGDKTSAKPKFVSCPDCGGTRYIPKGKCDKCGGAGKYRTPVTRGIGGRPMGGRMTQCDKCKGKGEIKDSCKTCRGRGKVKQ